jgi:hypothetical protein
MEGERWRNTALTPTVATHLMGKQTEAAISVNGNRMITDILQAARGTKKPQLKDRTKKIQLRTICQDVLLQFQRQISS